MILKVKKINKFKRHRILKLILSQIIHQELVIVVPLKNHQ